MTSSRVGPAPLLLVGLHFPSQFAEFFFHPRVVKGPQIGHGKIGDRLKGSATDGHQRGEVLAQRRGAIRIDGGQNVFAGLSIGALHLRFLFGQALFVEHGRIVSDLVIKDVVFRSCADTGTV